MTNAALFIDGSNFYNRLKDLDIRNTAQFDYRGLAQLCAQRMDVCHLIPI